MVTVSTGHEQKYKVFQQKKKKNAKKNSAISVDMYTSETFSVKKAILFLLLI